jgi:hypothetical protein
MRPPNYSECKRLEDEVTERLEKLRQLMTTQLALFTEDNQSEFIRLDRELENTVGGKERRVGALRQHQKDQAVQLHAVFVELRVARV